jgi:hypothetical protein
MTHALIDSKIAVFAQNPHFIIPVEVFTLVDIKYLNYSNVNQDIALKNKILNVVKYITVLPLFKALQL